MLTFQCVAELARLLEEMQIELILEQQSEGLPDFVFGAKDEHRVQVRSRQGIVR